MCLMQGDLQSRTKGLEWSNYVLFEKMGNDLSIHPGCDMSQEQVVHTKSDNPTLQPHRNITRSLLSLYILLYWRDLTSDLTAYP